MHFKEAKSILSSQNGMNLYRGCTHGCIYCDSRSKCYQIHHAFEDVEVKSNAPELLEQALKRKRKKCMIGTGSMSDPYLPIESNLGLTRRCLDIIEENGFGLSILTKSNLILRDFDLLKKINQKAKCVVQMTLTTFDEDLCRIVEPNVSTTRQRFETLKIMHENGIPTIVWLCPILPFINDTEENLTGILNYCIEAGVKGILCFGFGMTLREGDREYYYSKLDEHFPGIKEKYQHKYGNDYDVMSDNNPALMKVFLEICNTNHMLSDTRQIFSYLSEFPLKKNDRQLDLFDSV